MLQSLLFGRDKVEQIDAGGKVQVAVISLHDGKELLVEELGEVPQRRRQRHARKVLENAMGHGVLGGEPAGGELGEDLAVRDDAMEGPGYVDDRKLVVSKCTPEMMT